METHIVRANKTIRGMLEVGLVYVVAAMRVRLAYAKECVRDSIESDSVQRR